jgi:hypothetical protein
VRNFTDLTQDLAEYAGLAHQPAQPTPLGSIRSMPTQALKADDPVTGEVLLWPSKCNQYGQDLISFLSCGS